MSRGETVGGPINWKLHVPASPAKVFEALNTNEGRASFWAESAVERDGVIHFEFINGTKTSSRILDRESGKRFSIDYFGAVATFELEPDGKDGTVVALTHRGVDFEEWHEVYAGWLNVLFPLKAHVAFAVDLRNHDPKRTWEEGYVDQ